MPSGSENNRRAAKELASPPSYAKASPRTSCLIPGLVFAIGYILSPLSWWNDAFVNLPLAYLLGNATNFFFPGSFQIGVIAAYWLSNLAGILFMLWAGSRLLGKAPPKRRELWLSAGVSLLYTLALYFLMRWGIVRPFEF
jgi:hypothetical protein